MKLKPGSINRLMLCCLLAILCTAKSFAQPPSSYDSSSNYWVRATDIKNAVSKELVGVATGDSTSPPNMGGPGCTDYSTYMFTAHVGDALGFEATAPGGTLLRHYNSHTDVYLNGVKQILTLMDDLDGGVMKLYASGVWEFRVFMNAGPIYCLHYYIIAIPKIKKAWIEAPPICNSWTPGSDNKYHFSIKTDPPIDSIVSNYDAIFGTTGYVWKNCVTSVSPVDIHLNMNATNDTLSTIPYNISITPDFYTGATNLDYISPHWPDSSHIGGHNTYDFSILYDGGLGSPTGGLKDFLSGGIYSGQNLYLSVSISDGIPDTALKDTIYFYSYSGPPRVFHSSAPVPILSSVADVLAHPGTASVTPSYLSGLATPAGTPVGTPNPSFDFYDYHVTATWAPHGDHWLAGTNPEARMHGNDEQVIRIEHQVIIDEGATLEIEGTGMRLEMGPGASIVVNHAASGTGTGGTLAMSSTTVTAYRGCTGTEHSTWAGIRVMGNPAWDQGLSGAQGMLFHSACDLSYADVAVENGDAPSTAGGVIYSYAGSRFTNNREAVKLWPYHRYAAGKECGSLEVFSGSTFKNDAVWFSPDHFVWADDIMGMNFSNCTFIDTTPGYVMKEGISAIDAGMKMYFSSFRNLRTGIDAIYSSGAHNLYAGGCTFTGSKYGVWLMGGTANMLEGNTFNIPAYSGPTTYMPYTTDVVVLNDQSIGAITLSATAYNITNNIFQTNASMHPGLAPHGYYPNTTGTLQYNTGSSQNQVSDNTFEGLGVAMLSNYKNNYAGKIYGLVYSCNTVTHANYDISAVGYSGGGGGIAAMQYTHDLSMTILPAGNKFGGDWNIFNQQTPLLYMYSPSRSYEAPVTYTGSTVSVSPVGAAPSCWVPSAPPYVVGGGSSKSSAQHKATDDEDVDTVISYKNYALASANLNYYMTDSMGWPHRDSVYFWARQMHTAYGDLLIADLLIAL